MNLPVLTGNLTLSAVRFKSLPNECAAPVEPYLLTLRTPLEKLFNTVTTSFPEEETIVIELPIDTVLNNLDTNISSVFPPGKLE